MLRSIVQYFQTKSDGKVVRGRMEVISQEQNRKYNTTFGILSAVAMVMIVAGHADCNILTVGELFPYYSFHVPLFVFISGYFYRPEEETHPVAYLKKKCRRLLVPYFFWNVFYGLVAWGLRAAGLFAIGGDFSIWNLFVEPFVSGYQFLYNYAAWFVPALLLIEVGNLVMRLLLKKLHLCYEWLILAITLFVGMAVVWLAIGGHVWGIYKMPGRLLFLYPFFQMGQLYARHLEKHDRLSNAVYFAIVLGIQFVITITCGGLAYSSVWCTGFANGPVIPYVSAVTGIAFWLRICRILSPALEKCSAVLYLGKNTYAVMVHHVMAFMLVKVVLAVLSGSLGVFADFDWEQYRTNVEYFYLAGGAESFKLVYLGAGIVLPLLLQKLFDKRKENRKL